MTAGKSARGDWATIRARISEWGDVHLFSDTTEALKGSNLVFNWDSDSDLLTSFNAWLREKGLTCIAYNEETWIVVAYADAERSLAAAEG